METYLVDILNTYTECFVSKFLDIAFSLNSCRVYETVLGNSCKTLGVVLFCFPLKTPPYFHFSMYRRENVSYRFQVFCLLINSVTNKYIRNTLRAFNRQHFLTTDLLRLNNFLFVPLIKSCLGMYNINAKNSKIEITRRPFPESSNGKL